MKHLTEPLRYCRSLTDIDGDLLRSIGVKTLLVDLDNTLVFWHTSDCLPGASDWLEERRRDGFDVYLFSNAGKKRAESFASEHGIGILPYAGKPWTCLFRNLSKRIRAPKSEWAVIGDQIYTDVLCGNLMGVKTLYVFPYSEREWWWTRFVRRIERFVLKKRGIL